MVLSTHQGFYVAGFEGEASGSAAFHAPILRWRITALGVAPEVVARHNPANRQSFRRIGSNVPASDLRRTRPGIEVAGAHQGSAYSPPSCATWPAAVS